jgi:hypothetical protein
LHKNPRMKSDNDLISASLAAGFQESLTACGTSTVQMTICHAVGWPVFLIAKS